MTPVPQPQPPRPVLYVGLVTRAWAFAADAAIANLIAMLVAAIVALILSIVHLPQGWTAVLAAAGGAAWLLWVAGYFVCFWATTGQTPGNRLARIRVVGADGALLRPRRAVVRFGGLLLAALPLFLGFVPVLTDGVVTLRAHCPADLDAVVLHALVKDREGRYQSAEQFRSDLVAVRNGRQVSPEALTTAHEASAAAPRVLVSEPGGATTAPIANAAGHPRSGMSACTTTATTAVVAITSPTESHRMGRVLARKSTSDVCIAAA